MRNQDNGYSRNENIPLLKLHQNSNFENSDISISPSKISQYLKAKIDTCFHNNEPSTFQAEFTNTNNSHWEPKEILTQMKTEKEVTNFEKLLKMTEYSPKKSAPGSPLRKSGATTARSKSRDQKPLAFVKKAESKTVTSIGKDKT